MHWSETNEMEQMKANFVDTISSHSTDVLRRTVDKAEEFVR